MNLEIINKFANIFIFILFFFKLEFFNINQYEA